MAEPTSVGIDRVTQQPVAALPDDSALHKGHRDRLRARFLSEGLDAFDDHEVLALALFYAVAR